MLQSEQTNELNAALAKAQGSIENAKMDRENTYFKSSYATLASVRDAIKKPLSDNGLSITQTMEVREGAFVLLTTLWHSSGQWVRSEYPLPTVAKPQEMGSAVTYARRYALAAMVCNSSDEDDDGNAAQDAGQKVDATKAAPKKPKEPAPNPVQPQPPKPPAEPTPPTSIPVPNGPDGKPDWIAFAVAFKEAVEVAFPADRPKWLQENQLKLTLMEQEAKTMFGRLQKALVEIYPDGLKITGA